MAKQTYREIGYDVWGNDKDGYEVNDVYKRGLVEIDPDKDLVKEMRKAGLLRKGVRSSRVQIEGESDYTLYVTDARNGRPEFELRLEPQEA